MQTVTKTFNIYKFEELNPIIQNNIIEKWRDKETFSDYADESTHEDATNILKIFGFSNINIAYTGFYSQGDGASFTGDYIFSANSLEKIKEYAPQDTTLHDIAQTLNDIQEKLNGQIRATIVRTNHRYSHANTVSTTTYIDEEELDSDLSQEIGECFKNLMRWIYKQLEMDYNDWTSEENIKEEITLNDYDFLENGQIYNS